MMILISVVRPNEVIEVLSGGADIVDVKDPSKGSLGSPSASLFESIVRIIRSILHERVTMSVALGDNPKERSALELLSIAEERLVNYAKVGSLGLGSISEAVKVYKDLRAKVENLGLVAVAYADYNLIKSLRPVEVLEAAYKSDYDVFMIDTFVKNGRSTFDYLRVSEIREIKNLACDRGMLFALAGSLGLEHARVACEVKPDIVGFRSAACIGGRTEGMVVRDKVKLLVETYKRYCEIANLNEALS